MCMYVDDFIFFFQFGCQDTSPKYYCATSLQFHTIFLSFAIISHFTYVTVSMLVIRIL